MIPVVLDGRQGPRGPAEAAELLAEARAKLEELRSVAGIAVRMAQAALAGGRLPTKAEHKALSRAASLARYVADCAHRAAWEPPRGRARSTGVPMPDDVDAPAVPTTAEHDRQALELLRSAQLTPQVEALAPEWCERVRAWLLRESVVRSRFA